MRRLVKLTYPIIFILLVNCGFEVLDKSLLNELQINKINTVGDKRINFLIKNKINKLISPNSSNKLININIISKKNKKIKEKNNKNKITKYTIEVISEIEILFVNQNIRKKNIVIEQGYYNVTDNNNTNRENQKQLENNLSEKISQEIIKNIFNLINDS